MMRKRTLGLFIVVTSLSVFLKLALAQQDKYTLRVPNGLAFSEVKGYDAWQDVAGV